jgi:Pyruvate/2-oxoacid:ferredoxin oxidoreductase delta subunit
MDSQPNEKNFYSKTQVQEIADEIERVVIMPVNSEIEIEHRIFTSEEMISILQKARKIVLQDCGCKTEYGNCDSPREICLTLDEEADYALKNRKDNSKEIEIDEALSVLRKSHEAGLVHMAYIMKGEEKPGLICSCCSCCCHTLGGLLKYGIHAQILSSAYIAEDVREKCINCGECVNRCKFGARLIKEDSLLYNMSKCRGCGLCVSSCPTQAIKMRKRVNLE